MSLRRTPFHRVLHRPHLLLGGERELVMMTAFVAGALPSPRSTWWPPSSAVLWFGCLAALRRMAKADPQMSRVYVAAAPLPGLLPCPLPPLPGPLAC